MNNSIAKPRKPSAAELAKLLTAQHAQIYELTATNAVPTIAKAVSEMKPRERYYLLAVV
jgi:ABC-type glycerol-3-phosphate transport system substrate-binding protein